MRFVLYDEDTMEPLTVLPVTFGPEMWRNIKRGMPYRVHVPMKLDWTAIKQDMDITEKMTIPIVTMRFEPVWKDGKEWFWLALTRDSEDALKLRAVFLPGQRKEVRRAWEDGFSEGIAALFR